MNDRQFRFFTLSIAWSWLLIFALVPTLMVIITSFLEMNAAQNITAPFYIRKLRRNDKFRLFKNIFYGCSTHCWKLHSTLSHC